MAKKPVPLRLSTDPLPFLAVIDWCEEVGLPVTRCSPYQIKVHCWNFYTRGTFHMDGDARRRGVGVAAFKAAVESWLEEEGLSEALKRWGSRRKTNLKKP
jgi:hypothetical protein